jgi:hypothetical protein
VGLPAEFGVGSEEERSSSGIVLAEGNLDFRRGAFLVNLAGSINWSASTLKWVSARSTG